MNPDNTQTTTPQAGGNVQSIIANFKAANPTAVSQSQQSNPNDWYSQVKAGAYAPTTPTTQPASSGGIISDINNIGNTRGAQIASAIVHPAQVAQQGGSAMDVTKAVGEAGLNAAGAVAGGIGDFIGEGIKAITPQPVLDVLSKAAGAVGGTAPAQAIAQKWTEFATAHPQAAQDLGSVFNVGALTVGGAEAGKVAEVAAPGVAEAGNIAKNAITSTVKGAGEDLAAKGAQKATQEAWNIVKPSLSTTEEAAARKVPGQITQDGILKTSTLNPVGRNAEMLKASEPLLAGTKSAAEAVPKLQQGIVDEATKLRAGLDQSNAIWNQNELKGAINAIEKPHLLSGDLEKSFDKTMKVVLDQSTGANKKLSGLLDVRQNLDKIVAQQYPNLYNSDTMTAMKSAITQVRGAINDLIEKKLPEGVTADGTPFKDSLKKQSLLYDAVDNAAANATKESKVGTNVISRTIKAHPTASKIAAGAIGGGLVTEGVKGAMGL
jgi:hypothetical protein